MQNLQKILEILIKSPIDFVLVGGFAAVLHGCNQSTRDIDICLALLPDQIDIIKDVLKPINPKIRNREDKPSLSTISSLESLMELHLETDFGTLDIISHVEAVGGYLSVLRNAEEIELYGGTCHLISIDDLIKSKKMLGRYRDLMLVEELEAIKRERGQS